MDCANDGWMNGGIFGHLVGLFRSVAVVALARDDHETMTTNCAPRLILIRRHFASMKKKQRGMEWKVEREGKVHKVTIWRGGGGCATVHPHTQS